jgi:hypothetical protein
LLRWRGIKVVMVWSRGVVEEEDEDDDDDDDGQANDDIQ